MPFQLKHEQNQNFPLEQIIGSAPHALQLTDTSKEEKRHHKKKGAEWSTTSNGGRHIQGQESLILRDHKPFPSLQKSWYYMQPEWWRWWNLFFKMRLRSKIIDNHHDLQQINDWIHCMPPTSNYALKLVKRNMELTETSVRRSLSHHRLIQQNSRQLRWMKQNMKTNRQNICKLHWTFI